MSDHREERLPSPGPGQETIAVVGIGCRYPGGVRDLDGLWRVLAQGQDVTSPIPVDRWSPEFVSRDRSAVGTMYCGQGGFLEDVDGFDARFFGITPREAAEIDPQHRLLLQTAWEAMEDAGIARERWEGSRTGVFTGILGMDYTLLQAKTSGPAGVGPYYASGREASFGAGRIAYTFGLHGPCMMINSACSSSLLAVHLAAQSLRAQECDAALAGGVNLMLAPELSIFMSRIEALSATGRSRPFDTSADGVVRGEGCAVVVLKRLSDATADGDRIYAVLEGSATVHDGRSAGLIAPNAEAQEMLLRAALKVSGLTKDDIGYVETHCTGTPLGDRLEVGALAAVLGGPRAAGSPLLIGSHKANFGHCDSAAGVLGLLKGILVARHGLVPPQINLDLPIDQLAEGNLRVARELTPLPGDGPHHVGVSAFGLSGSNVHVVVASPPAPLPSSSGPVPHAVTRPGHDPSSALPVLTVSAPDPQSLAAQAVAYRDVVAATSDADLPTLLHSASVRRTHHDFRLAVTGTTGAELAAALDAHASGGRGVATGDVLGGRPPRIVYAFSGQGSQWPGMGLDLRTAQPVLREALDECDALVRDLAGWSLVDEITRGDRLARTEFAQPAVFAVQVALSRLWTSWGLPPAAVIGHSLGEVAAAHTAGTIGLREALGLVLDRGRLMQRATGSGRMTQVSLPEETVREGLRRFGGDVVVAAVNGPQTVVVAGPTAAVEQATAQLKRMGARCLPLGVDFAFHSPAVHPHGDELERLLRDLVPGPARIPLLSSVDPGDRAPATDAAYWGRNVREAVRFWPAVDGWLAERDALFVEIGPHPVLTRPLRDALAHRNRTGTVVSSLGRDRSGALTLARSLSELYTKGAPIDWRAVHPARGGTVPLPPVELRNERYWMPGVARGAQGSPVTAGPTGLRAEVRIFDSGDRLVAQLGGSSTAPVPAGAAPLPVTPLPEVAPPAVVLQAVAPGAGTVGAADTPIPAGHDQVARTVGRIAAEVLGVGDQRLSRVRGLYELGFDSFSVVELVARLRLEFRVDLAPTVALEHPSIDELARYLLTSVTDGPNPPTQGASDVTHPVAVTVTPADPATVTTTHVATTHVTTTGTPAPERPVAEPIAVVGMGCRLPGATGLEEFWSLLANGVDATGPVPEGRWDTLGGSRDTRDPASTGPVPSGRGAFVRDVDQFDNAFFRVSAREARSMDPQQRMFLEVAWEALEDAGLPGERLRGSRTGLFVGLNTTDYGQLLSRDPDRLDLYYGTGTTFSASAGRMSYFLGVRGPSLAVDTACASSLTAVHLACQSLRSGESRVAVAGGANALLTPTVYRAMTAGGALAADGRCKTFSRSADGYGRGEGAAAVVLKPLAQAQADGDRIYAVLRGSAVNHNGASGGLTVPSADAQAEVITDALAQAGVAAADVDYVEAHGTGTPLGDPIELHALDRVLGEGRPASRPLRVGSVKTNIAHLEAAAGIAGLVKTVLSLWHGRIPAHLHLEDPSPQVAWDRLRLRVVTRDEAWTAPPSGRPRTAGVSAFGFTGTNAHVVLEEAPGRTTVTHRPAVTRPYVLAVSAASPAALTEAAQRIAGHLQTRPDDELADVCHTLDVRRSHLEHRLVVLGADRRELLAALSGAPQITGRTPPGEIRRAALVFGPSVADLPWDELYAGEPAFAAVVDAAEALTPVRAALRRPAPDPVATVVAQIALAALWTHHGVHPDALMGQGIGEIAAAQVAGLLNLADSIRAAAGSPEPRLRGVPPIPVHLASLGSSSGPGHRNDRLSRWTPPGRTVVAFTAVGDGIQVLLDAGLTAASGELARGREDLVVVAADEHPDAASLARGAARLHVLGGELDWTALLAGRGRHVSAPGYPWQHRRYWIDTPAPAPDLPAHAVPAHAVPAQSVYVEEPSDPSECLFTVRWQPVELPPPDRPGPSGRWLVVPATAGAQEAGEAFTAALVRAGTKASTGVSPAGADDLTGLTDLTGVVLIAASADGRDPAGESAAETALAVARAAVSGPRPPRVWLVTTTADPDQAAAQGLLRVLAMEAPDAWGGSLDLPDLTETRLEAAVARLASPREPGEPVEDELRLRGSTWYAPRLVRLDAPDPVRSAPARHEGEYLVVGRTNPTVRPVIEQLVAAGARRLLLGHLGPDDVQDSERRWIQGLVEAGVEISQVDLTATKTGTSFLSRVTGGRPITGVVVVTGPVLPRPLAATGPDDLCPGRRLVALAAELEKSLRGTDLDLFCVLGSAAAAWGSTGFAAAGALDAGLSAVADRRSQAGRTATVLRWMPGTDPGELTRRDRLAMENSGLDPLSGADVSAAAQVLLRRPEPLTADVARVDLHRYLAACRRQTPRGFFQDLLPPEGTGDGDTPRPRLVSELLALHPLVRGDIMLDLVLRQIADVLGEDGAEADPDRGFFELGMDSVMAIALRSRLDEAIGVDLPATLTFEFPTGRALAQHLLQELEPAADVLLVTPGPPAAGPDDDLEALSDQELIQRLTAGLALSDQLLDRQGLV